MLLDFDSSRAYADHGAEWHKFAAAAATRIGRSLRDRLRPLALLAAVLAAASLVGSAVVPALVAGGLAA